MDHVSDPLVGFRCWLVNDDSPVLRSVVMNSVWPARQAVTAECMIRPSRIGAGLSFISSTLGAAHLSPPEEGCRCGLYARTTIDGCREEYQDYPYSADSDWSGYIQPIPTTSMVMGAVLRWGRILRGTKVIRAEHARIICLTETDDLWRTPSRTHQRAMISAERGEARRAALAAVVRDYKLPVIPHQSVTAYAAEFGDLG
jgi:hypothetical protein